MKPISVLFFGTPEFACPTLAALLSDSQFKVLGVVTQPDRPAGRGGKLSAPPIKDLALQASLPVFQPPKIRPIEATFLSEVQAAVGVPDISVVVAFGQILPKATLAFAKHGAINVHASLLPRWRGAAPIQRAIMAGDAETGVMVMQMDEGLDTGPVFATSTYPIEPGTTSGELHAQLAHAGASLVVKTVPAIVGGTLTATPQASSGVTHAAKISAAEMKIDWRRPAHEVAAHICGLSPAPGAVTTLNGKILKVLRAVAIEDTSPSSQPPGTVVAISPAGIDIACGSSVAVLRILELQLEGKKRLLHGDFVRGNHLSVGTLLGESV